MLSCAEEHKHWNLVGFQIDYKKFLVGTDVGFEDRNWLLNFPNNISLKIGVVGTMVSSI